MELPEYQPSPLRSFRFLLEILRHTAAWSSLLSSNNPRIVVYIRISRYGIQIFCVRILKYVRYLMMYIYFIFPILNILFKSPFFYLIFRWFVIPFHHRPMAQYSLVGRRFR